MLFTACDPSPVLFDNPSGGSPLLLLGDHAGNAIPAQLEMLGVAQGDLRRHIGWDIGIRALGAALSESLDAAFIHQPYSRLVIDCNRAPEAADAVPAMSDGTYIPANQGLDAAARDRRVNAIHRPYHAFIADEIERRRRSGQRTILVAIHSFTPRLAGVRRPWHAGILFDAGDTLFARSLLARLREQDDLCVGDNQPYRMDSTDYTIPRHAYQANIPYAEIEVRQDLLADPAGIGRWRDILTDALERSR